MQLITIILSIIAYIFSIINFYKLFRLIFFSSKKLYMEDNSLLVFLSIIWPITVAVIIAIVLPVIGFTKLCINKTIYWIAYILFMIGYISYLEHQFDFIPQLPSIRLEFKTNN